MGGRRVGKGMGEGKKLFGGGDKIKYIVYT